jgi:hypothetical protein
LVIELLIEGYLQDATIFYRLQLPQDIASETKEKSLSGCQLKGFLVIGGITHLLWIHTPWIRRTNGTRVRKGASPKIFLELCPIRSVYISVTIKITIAGKTICTGI